MDLEGLDYKLPIHLQVKYREEQTILGNSKGCVTEERIQYKLRGP
jgi:hypothetical protein